MDGNLTYRDARSREPFEEQRQISIEIRRGIFDGLTLRLTDTFRRVRSRIVKT